MRTRLPNLYLALLSTLCLASIGCHLAFQNSSLQPVYRATLDDQISIDVQQYGQRNALLRGPECNFSALLFNARTPGATLASAEFRQPQRYDEPIPAITPLEGRTDRAHQRVWLVDTTTKRIVVAADLTSGFVAGPHDRTPPWARPDEGEPLPATP